MILDNPVARLVLKAISVFGWIDSQRESATSRSDRVQRRESPFVLVARAPGGRWGVFERNFDKPLVVFDELQDACNHANEVSKARTDSMVLIQRDAIFPPIRIQS